MKVFLRIFLALLLVLPASAAPAPPIKLHTVEGITEYRLANGLRVLLFPDSSASQITVNLTYLVGSRHEGYGETGMAHLLEHLMFKGSKKHKNTAQELAEHGARANGTTSFDRTNYYETFNATDANLKWALSLEADRMVNSFIAKKDLDSEMTVVRNEFESGENSPGSVLFERVLEMAYIWHNYANPTIGARSDIEKVPIERLQAFYRKYYQPDNAILVVAGKIDEKKTLGLIQQYFAPIPAPKRKLFPTYTEEPTQDGERQVNLRRVGDVQLAMAVYHIPAGSHKDFAPCDVLGEILSDTPSGRLYKALVPTNLAVGVSGGAFQLREPGLLVFDAEVAKDGDLQKASDEMIKTVEAAGANLPTAEEMERARTSLLKGIDLTLNASDKLALELSEWAAMGDWRLFFLHRDRLEKVTAEEVQRVAQTYLKSSNRTVGWFLPTPAPERAVVPWVKNPAAAVQNYKGRPPVAAGEVFDSSPQNIEKRTQRSTIGGLKVAMLPKKTRGETVQLALMLEFGSLDKVRGRSTAADFAGSMLLRGTTKLSREQIADELDRLKTRMSVSGGADHVVVRIDTRKSSLVPALRLMAQVLREPAFSESEFELMRKSSLAALDDSRNDPESLAAIVLARHLSPYPKGHPSYVETVEETEAEIKGATLAQVKGFYQDFYGASNGQLSVVGEFDPAEVTKLVTELLADWKSPQPYARIPSEYFEVGPLVQTIVVKDKANAVVTGGENLKLQDDNPDYPALVLGNYILGGGFLNSRLATRIRQKEGLSYSVGSSLSAGAQDPAGEFSVDAISAPQNAAKVEKAIREELEKALKGGFTADEVEKAKSGYLQSRAGSRAKDSSLVSVLLSRLYLGRTMEWDIQWEERIRALTPEQLRQALARHIDLARLSIIKAGDL